MSVEIDSVRNFTPEMSITNPSLNRGDAIDRTIPLTYVQWVQNVNLETRDTDTFAQLYSLYIKAWGRQKNKSEEESKTIISDRYKALLIDITLNYTTPEERRFLGNIDFNDIRHVESSLPLYVSKIKQITLYISRQRDILKQQKAVGTVNGSMLGVMRDISNTILNKVLDPTKFNIRETIAESEPYFNVKLVELYDMSQRYFREQIVPELNTIVFKGFDSIVSEVLKECRPVLELSNNVKLVLNNDIQEVNVNEEVQNLNHSEFYNYQKSINNLNSLILGDYVKNRLGDSVYELKRGELSVIASPDKPWRDILNRTNATINTRHDLESLKSINEIGGFFTPKHTGILTFYSHRPVPIVTDDSVDVPFLQNVYKYGNSVYDGTSNNPVDHFEDMTWMKADISNGSLYGDVVKSRQYARFSGYTTFDEVNQFSTQGLSRSTDALGFFGGEKNKTWTNEDVFPVKEQFNFDLQARQDTLLVGHRTMYKWRTDIFGNEYALYKSIQPERGPFDIALDDIIDFDTDPACEVLDGGNNLHKQKERDAEDVETDMIDGGRISLYDPKIEQYQIPIPFPDLRKVVDVDENGNEILENWNTHYYGMDPTEPRPTFMKVTPITFHGFAPDVKYDKQAYAGLFTDDTCGRILPSIKQCSIVDNYAFRVFSEDIDDNGNSISLASPVVDREDAFDQYVAPTTSDWSPEFGFSMFGNPDDRVTFQDDGDIDGWFFDTEVCDKLKGDFEHVEVHETFYDQTLDVGETEYSDEPEKTRDTQASLYEQQTSITGQGYFRSYNSEIIQPFSVVLDDVIGSLDNLDPGMFVEFKEDVYGGKILDFDIIYDTIIIETLNYLFIEKIRFSGDTLNITRTGTNNVFIKTTGLHPEVEKSIGWFFDDQKGEIIFGYTRSKTIQSEGDQTPRRYVYPVIMKADLETLQIIKTHPNRQYRDQNEELFILNGELSQYHVGQIDRPIITFNETSNTFNLSYTAQLDRSNRNRFAIFSFDYRMGQFNFRLQDSYVFHGKEVETYEKPGEEWDDRVNSRELQLDPSLDLMPRFPSKTHTTKTESLSSITGLPLSGYEFDLTLDTKTIPVGLTINDFKINRIIFDPGDGGEIQIRDRVIDDGLQPLTFDLTELPDPGDFGDPRRLGFKHNYTFDKSVPHCYTATVSAIYSNFTTLTYKLDIETLPYDTNSGFDGLKLISSKLFTDPEGKDRQLFTLETQRPRWVSNVIVDRNNTVKPPIEGYVDGSRYIGSYHTTPEGVFMTGESPSPESKRITQQPTTEYAEDYLKTEAYGTSEYDIFD